MSVLSLISYPCLACHPGDWPAVLPFLVTRHEESLKAWYKHEPCGTAWSCLWDAEAPVWPLSVDIEPGAVNPAYSEPVTPEQAARNRHVLERELEDHDPRRGKASPSRGRRAA